MRRKDKEISGLEEKLEIIKKCKICRLGLCDNNYPYIVPLNYGFSYENGVLTLFFHGATEGKKIEMIKNNDNACFETDCDTKLIEGEVPCDYGYAYKSIVGFGKIKILETGEEKTNGLNTIMKQQTGKEIKYEYDERRLNNVTVFKLTVDEFTGKQKIIR